MDCKLLVRGFVSQFIGRRRWRSQDITEERVDYDYDYEDEHDYGHEQEPRGLAVRRSDCLAPALFSVEMLPPSSFKSQLEGLYDQKIYLSGGSRKHGRPDNSSRTGEFGESGR